jgi:beta-alanine degradation protein BauB
MKSKLITSGLMIIIFAAGVAVGAWQQQGGTRREPQFKNADVEVWKSIIMPNQPLSLHRHDLGRTIVALKGGTLDVTDKDGKTLRQMVWETGKAYWLDADPPGELHGDMNRTNEPIEVMVIQQLKK